MHIGKFNSQERHRFDHWYTTSKWYYEKDPNRNWGHFYTPFHNPTSTGEKIVDWIINHTGNNTEQIWALYNIKIYYWR